MGRPYDPGTDLVRHELAESLRIPIVTSPHPRWYYVTAIVVSDLYGGQMPTDDEIRVVASFNDEYREHIYRNSWKDRMREFAPFDIDGGAVGRYLIKYQRNGGWGYRLHTWQYGPEFVPEWSQEPVGLVEALDRCHTIVDEVSPRWVQWKADHAGVFGALAEAQP